VIGGGVEIGQMVTIGQHVTLGGNFGKRNTEGRSSPRVGNWCWICAGSVVAGPISVGHCAVVGANSLVVRDVPAYAVVGGVPAKIIRMQDQVEKRDVSNARMIAGELP
jgi:serine O-acetyltransferase